MPGPISPDAVQKAKNESIPEVVYEVFNAQIVKNWDGKSAVVRQDEIIDILVGDKHLERSDIFGNNWLDVEYAYRELGWVVIYDKPGYNEDYPATFKFMKAPNR